MKNTEQLDAEINELFHSDMDGKHTDVHMLSLAEDLQDIDVYKGNFWLGVIALKEFLKDIDISTDNDGTMRFKDSGSGEQMMYTEGDRFLCYDYAIYQFLESIHRYADSRLGNTKSINAVIGMAVAEHYDIKIGEPQVIIVDAIIGRLGDFFDIPSFH